MLMKTDTNSEGNFVAQPAYAQPIQAPDPQKSSSLRGPEYYIPRFKKVSATVYTLTLVPRRIALQEWFVDPNRDVMYARDIGPDTLPDQISGSRRNIYFREWKFAITKRDHPGWWRYNSITKREYLPFKVLFAVIDGKLKSWGFNLDRMAIIKLMMDGGENSPEIQEEFLLASFTQGRDPIRYQERYTEIPSYKIDGANLFNKSMYNYSSLMNNISDGWIKPIEPLTPKPKAPPPTFREQMASLCKKYYEVKQVVKKGLFAILNRID